MSKFCSVSVESRSDINCTKEDSWKTDKGSEDLEQTASGISTRRSKQFQEVHFRPVFLCRNEYFSTSRLQDFLLHL